MAAIAVPMSDLTKKGAVFTWKTPQQAALQKLLTLIMKRIKIYEPLPHKQLVIMSDACNVGVSAAVFVQIPPPGTAEWDEEQKCIAACKQYREALGLIPLTLHPQTPRLVISDQERALYDTTDKPETIYNPIDDLRTLPGFQTATPRNAASDLDWAHSVDISHRNTNDQTVKLTREQSGTLVHSVEFQHKGQSGPLAQDADQQGKEQSGTLVRGGVPQEDEQSGSLVHMNQVQSGSFTHTLDMETVSAFTHTLDMETVSANSPRDLRITIGKYRFLYPVAFYSSKLNPAQRNYGATDREMEESSKNSRIIRALNTINEVVMDVRYVQGPLTVFGDYFSRSTNHTDKLLQQKQRGRVEFGKATGAAASDTQPACALSFAPQQRRVTWGHIKVNQEHNGREALIYSQSHFEFPESYSLNLTWVDLIDQLFGPFDVELFASHEDHVMDVYCTADGSGTWGTDAFGVDLQTPSAVWFPLLMRIAQGLPLVIPHRDDTFLHRGRTISGLPPWEYTLVVILQGGCPKPPLLPDTFWHKIGLQRAPAFLHSLGYPLKPCRTMGTGVPGIPAGAGVPVATKTWKWLSTKKAPTPLHYAGDDRTPQQWKFGPGKRSHLEH
ncbi:hypothetical protein SARC_08162 [Sphaeroforma arctica JP610]|uniref:Reverse transcriptase/retrotransposon-derived protein RNase H-like domain-containing protein n=1 Tax=Sphaeroforma arctica JP610 TaxID=667725 RepID=A0A0L0FU39_9EUKA|nr:hypothetical protein SARC_08162 [Sphaeroforma arctica JP610]KNC79443.1 hypothetical protein SARC_08162 [Sphaeroforma arctica JP610]|eukprot:XP_014153345.1 hypothetical protein SARC_08162 [Sphaeroforma arctica JP610]